MASEPAEPTTRQDREWLAGMIAAFLSGARGVGVLHMKPWPEVAERLVAWLDERQLLADPEQHTELEQLRESKRISLEINQSWVAYRERTKVRQREFLDQIATLTRERDERQARLEQMEAKITGLADEFDRRGHERDEAGADDSSGDDDTCAEEGLDCHTVSAVSTWFRAARLVRAALVGDQPPAEEPKRRCCVGPFADGTHAPGCLDACQDCGGDEAGPRRCQCGDADPACTCTENRCDYDGYPLDGPACLPCGQRPVGAPCLANDDAPLSGVVLRDVEERDDAAGDLP